METIELKDVMNQLPVADLVKNLAGVDKNGVPSQFTMENIAAVVGGKLGNVIRLNEGDNLDDIKTSCIRYAGSGVSNTPENYIYILTLAGEGIPDIIQVGFSIPNNKICIRKYEYAKWCEWRIL